MTQIPAFEYHIFISYTHNDNARRRNAPGWVDIFHEELENWLRKRRGLHDLKIWRDRELDGNTLFDDEIKQTIQSSALFLALNSPNYLQSEYCRQELACFYECNNANHRSLKVGNQHRILNVLLRNIPRTEWPETLGKTPGFPMHDAKSDELGDFTLPDTTLFKNQLRKIIDAIQKTLGAFPGKEPEALQHTSGESRLCVFFADVADTLQTHRERLVADIEDRDGVVLGDISLGSSKKHEASVKNALQQACFSIHLFDQWPGRKMIDKKEVSYPCIQLDLALKSDIPQIIWVPENLNYKSIQDETYRKWLEALENAGRKQKNHEFIRGTPGAFSEYILQKIAALQKSASPYRKTLSCLVDTHQKDQQRAFELSAVLSQKGIDVEFNKESYDPIRSLENFEDAIKHVKNLILIFGSVNPSWLQSRIKKAVNIAAERFHADAPIRLENIWVYMLPGSKNIKSLQRIPGMFNIKTLDNSHSQDIDPKVISPLLQPQYTGENA